VSDDTDTCSDSVEQEEQQRHPLFLGIDREDGSDPDVWEWTAGDPQNVSSREEQPFFTPDACDDDLWDLFPADPTRTDGEAPVCAPTPLHAQVSSLVTGFSKRGFESVCEILQEDDVVSLGLSPPVEPS
jgi:hypothetical protein